MIALIPVRKVFLLTFLKNVLLFLVLPFHVNFRLIKFHKSHGDILIGLFTEYIEKSRVN